MTFRIRTFRSPIAFIALLAAAALAPLAPAAAIERQPVTTTDLLRLRSVSSIDISADGSRAVFAVRSIETVTKPDAKDDQPTYHNRSHLFFLDLLRLDAADRGVRQLTHGPRADSSPKLSPDGRRIAFLRRAEDTDQDRSAQVWILPVDGGEARQVTHFKHGVRAVEWSPTANRLLVTAPVDFDELDGVPPWPLEAPRRTWAEVIPNESITPRPDGTREEIRAWLAKNANDQSPRVINRINFQDETSLRGPMRFAHLFIVDLNNHSNAQPRRITTGFFDHDDAAFMPDGRHIIFTAKKAVDRHPDRVLTNEIYMVSVDGSSNIQILRDANWRFRSPQPNRDGTMIAFLAQQEDEPTYRQWRIGLIAPPAPPSPRTPRDAEARLGARGPADSQEPTANSDIVWLTDDETFDYSVRRFTWLPGRTAILFNTAIEGAFPLMRISEGLLRPAVTIDEVGGLPAGVHAFGAGGGTIVYAATTAANPCVLRVRFTGGAAEAGGDRLVLDFNEWTADRILSIPSANWITRPDGTRVQYWVMEPTNRRPNRRYPTVLQIHGGPQAMWGPGEMTMWHEMQLFCAWGYGVVYSNPRGSSGYGYRFQKANYQNWGDGPAGDVLAALDHAMLSGPGADWIDRDMLVVTGGSYAGYLTAWIVAHDHRFKAAVAQRGVYHLPTFFGEGNAWRLVPWAMGGPPFDARVRSIIERESPFTYVSRIRTPLLIMHADNDLRTGVSQSEMMYRALKYLERPVEYVRYPGEGHDLSRAGNPRLRMDRLNRMIDFFERHIENPREAPVRVE